MSEQIRCRLEDLTSKDGTLEAFQYLAKNIKGFELFFLKLNLETLRELVYILEGSMYFSESDPDVYDLAAQDIARIPQLKQAFKDAGIKPYTVLLGTQVFVAKDHR